tara:strand:- start:218 stop:592 length:375 start_codon:yes stop_codon:yes gene_type:complete
MKIFYKTFFFLMIPLILVSQESQEVREMTEDEIKDYQENHYCVVSGVVRGKKRKFIGLENCVEGMPVWFNWDADTVMQSQEIAVKFCDFDKTIVITVKGSSMLTNHLVCVFKKNRNKSDAVFVN